jgi:hypothetical protein
MAVWYAVLAAAAGLAGPEYAISGLFAGVIPLTALSLMVATIRRKTVVTEDGHLRDISADSNDDPAPGIGLDDGTALGDTPARADSPADQQPGGRRFQREQERKGDESRRHDRGQSRSRR